MSAGIVEFLFEIALNMKITFEARNKVHRFSGLVFQHFCSSLGVNIGQLPLKHSRFSRSVECKFDGGARALQFQSSLPCVSSACKMLGE